MYWCGVYRVLGGAPAHRVTPLGALLAPAGTRDRADPQRPGAGLALSVPRLRPERRRPLGPGRAERPADRHSTAHRSIRALLRQGAPRHQRDRE